MPDNKGERFQDRVVNLEKVFGLTVDDYYYYDVSVSSFQYGALISLLI